MTFVAGIDEGLIGAKSEAVELSTSRTFCKSICRIMSPMLFVTLRAEGHSNRFVRVGPHSIEPSTCLTFIKSVNWLLVILFMIAIRTVRHERHQ